MGVNRLTISMENEFLMELKEIAKNQKKPVSQVVGEALKEWLFERKRRAVGNELLSLLDSKERLIKKNAEKELEIIREEWR